MDGQQIASPPATLQQITEVLESISDAFFAVDREWRFTYLNTAAELLLLRRRGDLLGKYLWDELPELVGSRFYQEYQRAMLDGVMVEFEEYYPPLNAWFAVRAYPAEGGLAVYFQNMNERHREAEELLDARDRLHAALAAAEVATWVWDIRNDMVMPDGSLARLFGLGTNETHAASLSAYLRAIHPDDRERVKDELRAAIDRKGDYEAEYRVYRPDGSLRWVVARGKVELDENFQPTRMPGSLIDITDRKKAQDDRERFFTVGTDMRVVVTFEGRTVRVNPEWTERLGWTLEDMQQLDFGWDRIVHPDDRAATAAAWEECCHNPEQKGFENRILSKSGEVHWIEWRSKSFVEEKLIYAAAADITERKLADHAIKRQAEQLHHLALAAIAVNAAPSLQAALDVVTVRAREIVDANISLVSVGRCPRGTRSASSISVTKKYAGHSFKVDWNETLFRRLEKTVRLSPQELERDTELQALLVQRPGVPRLNGLLAVPLIGKAGEHFGVLELSDKNDGDFTESDEAILVQLAQMASVAIENAEYLAATHEARAEAEAASHAKDQFMAVLSHELRTPLTPVLLTVSMLEHDPGVPEHLRSDIATIRRNVEMEARLIDDLLDLTRITRGKVQLDLQSADVHTLIRTAVEICRRDDACPITLHLDAPTYTVHGDPARLQQIFWNLLINALKFTPRDGLIEVRTREAEGRLLIEVSDTGIGIEHDLLPKVFNAFEQGKATARRFGGLGLGLAICQALVNLHGGSITVQSEGREKGSKFTVDLPLAASIDGESSTTPAAPAQTATGLRVLLVEDHPATAKVMAKLLQRMGHDVEVAGTVQDALQKADDHPHDLVISDLGLPDASGHELMKQLRGKHTIRGIAVSGFGMEEDVKRAMDSGFSAHVTKPIDVDRLQQTIQTVVSAA